MRKVSGNSTIREKIFNVRPYLESSYGDRFSMPLRSEFFGCCGLDLVTGIVEHLSYGVGKRKYSPLEIHKISHDPSTGARLSKEQSLEKTEKLIEKEKKETIDKLERFAKDNKSKAGTVLVVTHAQFIVVGKELYDLGYVAIVNNSISHGHNNRIIIMFRENEHEDNKHSTLKPFTYDEVIAAIDLYGLR